MAIEFHCDHCGKLVRAPDDAGGKRGRCPSCKQAVYIPTPTDEIEPLAVAPEDESEEQHRARLLRETHELERRLLEERDLPSSAPPPPPAAASIPIPRADMETLVIQYAQAMASGDLEQAEQLEGEIRTNPDEANNVIQRLMSDEIPPASLANIPRPVLMGFFRKLTEHH